MHCGSALEVEATLGQPQVADTMGRKRERKGHVTLCRQTVAEISVDSSRMRRRKIRVSPKKVRIL